MAAAVVLLVLVGLGLLIALAAGGQSAISVKTARAVHANQKVLNKPKVLKPRGRKKNVT